MDSGRSSQNPQQPAGGDAQLRQALSPRFPGTAAPLTQVTTMAVQRVETFMAQPYMMVAELETDMYTTKREVRDKERRAYEQFAEASRWYEGRAQQVCREEVEERTALCEQEFQRTFSVRHEASKMKVGDESRVLTDRALSEVLSYKNSLRSEANHCVEQETSVYKTNLKQAEGDLLQYQEPVLYYQQQLQGAHNYAQKEVEEAQFYRDQANSELGV